jgi:hypothetical protein
MAEREGFEPCPSPSEHIKEEKVAEQGCNRDSPIAHQRADQLRAELAHVVQAWPKLSPSLRRAILAIADSTASKGSETRPGTPCVPGGGSEDRKGKDA